MKFKSLLFMCLLSFLVACGESGVDSGQPTIVPEAPTISSFAASPDSLEAGQSSTLTWELAGGEATSVTISGVDEVTGSSAEVTPNETTAYTLTVRNEGGSDSATQTVTVSPVDTPQPAPPVQAPVISSFTATPETVEEGQSSTLTWELTGGTASSVTVSSLGEVTGSSTEVTPSETTTYTLMVTNEVGSDSATQTVTVSPADTPEPPVQAPVISSFTATPDTVEAGQSSTLTWELTGGEASSVTIDNSVGEVTGSSAEVTPSETTTYTLTATNEGGEDTQSVTVTVSSAVIVPPEEEVLQAGDMTITEEGPFIEVDVFGAEDTLYPDEGYTFPEIDISAQPSQGEAFTEDGAITYDSEGFVGTTTFEYTLSITNQETDEVLSDSGTVTVNVE